MSTKNVILDVDPGLDDAWAILAMLWGETHGLCKVRAITTVNGNSCLDNVTRNALRILMAAGRLDIPVYKGCSESILSRSSDTGEEAINFHLGDGFGDVHFEAEPDLGLVKKEHAVNAMRDIIMTEDNITLMCLGPLTNLALLLKLYPEVRDHIAAIWIMGGNRQGVGNITRAAEFNFFCDPEAAAISLEVAKCQIYLLPLETVRFMNPPLKLEWRFSELSAFDNAITKLLDPVEKSCWAHWNNDNWTVYDAIVAACFLDPKCITKIADYHVTVELGGKYTRGQAVLDHKYEQKQNVKVIEEFDVDIFRNIIVETVRNGRK